MDRRREEYSAFLAGPANEFSTAVGADVLHVGRTEGAERAFKSANEGFTGGSKRLMAVFALRAHLEGHGSVSFV
jgi:hypothetical protein